MTLVARPINDNHLKSHPKSCETPESKPPRLLAELFQSFKNLQAALGVASPEMAYEAPEPAFQTLPM